MKQLLVSCSVTLLGCDPIAHGCFQVRGPVSEPCVITALGEPRNDVASPLVWEVSDRVSLQHGGTWRLHVSEVGPRFTEDTFPVGVRERVAELLVSCGGTGVEVVDCDD